MEKVIVTLRSVPAASVEVPENFPKVRGAKEEKPRKIARSCFGALRFFPGVPKAISKDEFEYVELHRGDVAARLEDRPYVESKRLDYRGATEADLARLAEKEGLSHLSFKDSLERLEERGKVKKPDPRKSSTTRLEAKKPKDKPKTNGNGGRTNRKPR